MQKILKLNKAVSELEINKDGEIKAYLTTWENLDSVNDRMKEGSLDGYIKKFNAGATKALRMLFQHDRSEIIGEWDKLSVDSHGLVGTGTIFSDVSRGKDVKALLKRGVLDAVSIGFRGIDYTKNEEGGYDFDEIELVETSVVDTGANPEALILSVKSEDGVINVRKLEKVLRDAGLSIQEAKTVSSVAKRELSNVRDEQEADNELLKVLGKFNLNN